MSLHNQMSQAMSASILAQTHGLDPRTLPQHLLPQHLRLAPGLVGGGFDSALLARAHLQAQSRLPTMATLQASQMPPVIDPVLAAQYGYAQLLHGAGTRKNATRESTAPLKSWLKDHQKNPYPTKGEKIMLALVSGMTLTQVSTWFANARRRLKKENKWSPDAGFEDDEESTKIVTECTRAEESGYSSHNDGSSDHHSEHSSPRSETITPPPQSIQSRNIIRLPTISSGTPVIAKGPALVRSVSSDRPKIWSLAEMSSSSSNSGSTHDHSDSEMNPIQVS